MPEEPRKPLERFFYKLTHRPTAVFMLTLALLSMSVIAAQRIQLDLIPKGISSNDFSIRASWENANPSEIEQKIIKPLEKELRSVSKVESIYSEAEEGSAKIDLNFPGNVNVDDIYAEISDRIERARPLLPEEVDRIRIRREGMSSIPIMFAGIDFQGMDRNVAQDLITNTLLPRIETIDGVATATSWGIQPLSIRIWLDEESVFANNIRVGNLVRRLQGDNISAPIGDLESSNGRAIIRVDSRFKTIEEIENFPVRDGITIKDIGRVEEIRSAPNFMFRFGGNYGTSCQITKESSANTFDVCQSLENLLNNELANDPVLGRFKFRIYFNQGDMIQKSVFALINDAIIGGIIACIVLFFFLRNLPYTLLITLSIPFAVLISLSYIYFTGNTLNLMSMMGITISIGMLVDNSVVIVESIFKKREKGLSLINAICKGPSEVVLAIITATLTTIVVFLPLIFLTDNRQQQVIAEAIGMPLIIALISALVLSIIIVPVAAKIIGTKVKNKKSGQIPKFLTKPLFKILNWSLKFRFRAATLYALVLMSSSIATEGREMSITDNQQGGQINVRFSFTEGTTLIDGHEEVVNIEQTVLQTKDFQERFPEIAVGCWFTRSGGSLMVWPNRPLKDSEKTTLMEYLEKNLPQTARTKFRFSQEMQRGRTSRGKDWTRVRVQGPDHSVIQNIVQDIREAGNRSENFSEVSKERDRSNEVLVSLDRERMSQLGINSQSVIGNIEWTMRGFMVSRFETETQEIPIILEYDTPVKPDRGSLEELLVASEQSITPLSTFAEFKNSRGTTEINRLDGKISDVIGLKSIHKDPQKAAKDVGKLMSGIQMPEGYKWNISGGWSDAQNDMEDLQIALLIAIGLVFFLMGLLFNSIILPLSALTTIGFAITGANWAFKVTDHPFGAIEMVGMIVLAGVVVNNAIVLIDKILQLENSGIASSQAIIKAVEDRMRPVFMTALTTVCGLLPIAISEAAGNSVSFKGMAIGIIGGITLATFFTLTVVPLSFSIFRDFGKLCQNLFSGRKFT